MVVQEKGKTLFMNRKRDSAITLTLLLTSMLTLAFNIQQVKSEQSTQLLLMTNKDIYSLGENVTITILNVGSETVPIGGYPAWQIFTYPGKEPVYPKYFAFLLWSLGPGGNDIITWNQYNAFTKSFVEPGKYIVEDNQGWGLSTYFTIAGLKANFSAIPETTNVGGSIKFDASSSLPGWNGTHEMPITEYRWDFGDGNKTTISVPIVYHSFQTAGIYYVTLTVYAPGSTPETDSAIKKVTVISIPVGGYSSSMQVPSKTEPVLPYIALIATLTAIFTKLRPKTKRKR